MVVALAGAVASPAAASPGETTLESRSSDGEVGDSFSSRSSISGDGLAVAFQSDATNLVDGDTTRQRDVYVRDRRTGTIGRVSVATDGSEGNGWSQFPAISGDGRHVAFVSDATNLVAGDANGQRDVFVRDLDASRTVRVSVPAIGEANAGVFGGQDISGDGRYVAFSSSASNLVAGDTNARGDVFVHDRDADGDGAFDEPGEVATTRVSVAGDGAESNGTSSNPSISADGKRVAFESGATNLAPGDTNNRQDIFVRDVEAGTTILASRPHDGAGSNGLSSAAAISGDGGHVAFQSTATNLVAGDTNSRLDVFARDLVAGTTIRVSVASDGTQVSGFSSAPSISGEGRLVAFQSDAPSLVPGDTGDTDVFVRDRDADEDGVLDETDPGATATTLESVGSDGTQANDFFNGEPSVAADGSRVAFATLATNLAPDDDNSSTDVYTHRLHPPAGRQALTIFKGGDGQGTIASAPVGIDCGPDCTEDFAQDAEVTLTPNPAPGSEFGGFGGACTGTGPCTLTLDQARFVTASFQLVRHVLEVSRAGEGQGTVTSSPSGIDCGSDCTEDVVEGTEVTLTATATPGFPGYTFAGFSGGGCSGAGATCTVTLDEARTVTATFEREQRSLTVSKDGDGQGTVTSSPAGIDCGSDCTQEYQEGTEVTLTATPAAAFAGFSGACTGTGPCTVTLDRARSVTATFEDTSSGIAVPPAQPGPPDSPPAPPAVLGPVAPSFAPSLGVGGSVRESAKLEVARSRVLRSARRLEVLAPISRLASGTVRVEFFAAGRRYRFSERIDSARGRIRFSRRIPAAQARLGTGILTISYAGDADTRAQQVRLRAASRPAGLEMARPSIRGGRLVTAGTVSPRARGVVRVQTEYVVDGKTTTLELGAPIRNGRWRVDERLSEVVRRGLERRQGAVQSYTLLTGYFPARIRGEMKTMQIMGAR